MSFFGPTMDKSIGLSEEGTIFDLEERFAKRWCRIQDTLESILAKRSIQRRIWNERFSDVYAITVDFPPEYVDNLYDKIQEVLHTHITHVCQNLLQAREQKLLNVYLHHWDNFYEALQYINKLAMHLNSAVVKPAKINDSEFPMIHLGINLPDYSLDKIEILQLGCQMWADGIVSKMQKDLTMTLLEMIEGDRKEHDLAHSELMRRVVNSLVALDEFKGRSVLKTYREVFEIPYIQATGEHYRMEAVYLIAKTTFSQYVVKVLQRLQEEELRARRLCHPSTLEKIRNEVQVRMVNEHLGFILSGSRTLIEEKPEHDLINMYEVLRPCPEGIATLRQYFTSFVEEKAREAVGNTAQLEPQDLVENLDRILSRFEEMVNKVFNGDPMFRKAIEDAIKIVVNQQSGVVGSPFSSAELIARYCDNLLRRSAKNVPDVEDKLDGAIRIFRFLDDKDVFQRFYSRMMAKRLINKQSVSEDVEVKVISKLRDVCGCDYTGRLLRMQRDINSSALMMQQFFERFPLSSFRNKCGDLFINVLTSGVWPIPSFDIPFNIPVGLHSVIENFGEFYSKEYSGRRLTWIFQLGYVDVKLNYVKRPVIVTMTVQQLAICMAFSDVDSISMAQLKEMVGMPDEYLEVNIECLAQQGLMRRYQDTELGQTVALCVDYSPKKPRIKIAAPQTKEQPTQEREETERSTGDMRQLFLQATICRIMKSRISMSHQNLLEEVREIAQSRFAATVPMMKKAVDTLIEKDYIRRSPTAQDVYEYIV
ncbi:cullin-2-like [Paramacrobiotus metropolitanus]|uniref:cullin-2-like n=1 Tax=Paramacrobiotus metropolitanus TaxID=2943436 RepID=UPI00244608A5|nr:cullin-2-like [Paramacrobiotus metropolitanus]